MPIARYRNCSFFMTETVLREEQRMTINQRVENEQFDHIAAGEQRTLRFTEGSVHEGDTMILEEWDPHAQAYTGRKIETLITAVHPLPIAAEWAIQGNEERLQLVHFEPKTSKYTPVS